MDRTFGKSRPVSSLSVGVYDDASPCPPTLSRLAPTYFIEYQAEYDRLRAEIEALIKSWGNETVYISSITEMTSHPAYLRIIAHGKRALPFIFHELERAPDYWFTALRAITNEDPVPDNARGDMKAMRSYWLRWAAKEGYV